MTFDEYQTRLSNCQKLLNVLLAIYEYLNDPFFAVNVKTAAWLLEVFNVEASRLQEHPNAHEYQPMWEAFHQRVQWPEEGLLP